MTIRGAQKLLKENGVQHVINLSPPLEAGLVAEADPIESVNRRIRLKTLISTAGTETRRTIAQDMQQARTGANIHHRVQNCDWLKRKTKINLIYFLTRPSDNFWAEDDQTAA